MPQPQYSIVMPTSDDVEPMTAMWAQSWLDTYPNDKAGVSRDWVAARVSGWLNVENLAQRRQRILSSKDNPNTLWRIAKDKRGTIIGVIAPYRNEEAQHVGAVYVDKKQYGTGLAQVLMQEILDWADPHRPLELEVAAYNERAKAFYRKYGFIAVKDSQHLVHETIPVVTMTRKGDKQ